ncbi:MAG: ParB/RepB/Spo0J family partition protein [Lachnospiraceae bacterium]|nr:ParB/RepB/Spo0J family partition protein [Lachnospiraceae bacterium]
MANSTRFDSFIAEEVNKYQGKLVPVKASVLERIFVRYVACTKLHPNPYDEFSDASIGPNYEIISGYEHRIKESRAHGDPAWDDPILVEKMLPEGYLILNGHHRWAAATRFGEKRVGVKIVNLTQETDIKKMLEISRHDRRVAIDLDEVIFFQNDADGSGNAAEDPLHFPYNKLFKERLKTGVPALLHYLSVNGYDIWVYTSEYYSMDYINKLFKMYHVVVNGIITGIKRPHKIEASKRRELEKIMNAKYTETLHIDNGLVLLTHSDSKDFEEFDLSGNRETWAQEIMNTLKELRSKEATGKDE